MRGCCEARCSNSGCVGMVSLIYRTHQICPSPRCLSGMWLPLPPLPTGAPSPGKMVKFFRMKRQCNKVFYHEKC